MALAKNTVDIGPAALAARVEVKQMAHEQQPAAMPNVTNAFMIFVHRQEVCRARWLEERIYLSKIQLTSQLIRSAEKNAAETSPETKLIVDRGKRFHRMLLSNFHQKREQISEMVKKQSIFTFFKCRRASLRQFGKKTRSRYQLLEHPLHKQPHLEEQRQDKVPNPEIQQTPEQASPSQPSQSKQQQPQQQQQQQQQKPQQQPSEQQPLNQNQFQDYQQMLQRCEIQQQQQQQRHQQIMKHQRQNRYQPYTKRPLQFAREQKQQCLSMLARCQEQQPHQQGFKTTIEMLGA